MNLDLQGVKDVIIGSRFVEDERSMLLWALYPPQKRPHIIDIDQEFRQLMNLKIGVTNPNKSTHMQVGLTQFNEVQMKQVTIERDNEREMYEIPLKIGNPQMQPMIQSLDDAMKRELKRLQEKKEEVKAYNYDQERSIRLHIEKPLQNIVEQAWTCVLIIPWLQSIGFKVK